MATSKPSCNLAPNKVCMGMITTGTLERADNKRLTLFYLLKIHKYRKMYELYNLLKSLCNTSCNFSHHLCEIIKH